MVLNVAKKKKMKTVTNYIWHSLLIVHLVINKDLRTKIILPLL